MPVNDAVSTKEDTAVTIDVLANDTDVDSNATLNATPDNRMEIGTVGTASHGTVAILSNQVVYTPGADFNGTDTFTYTVSDGRLSGTARVSVTISQENDPIVANDDTASTTDEDPVEIDVLLNDTDVDTEMAKNLAVLHSRESFQLTSVGAAEKRNHADTERKDQV